MTEKKYYKWKPQDLKNAIHDYKNENIGLNECARLHKIPKATLKRHLDQGDTIDSVEISKGRPTVFPKEFEDILVDHILNLEIHMFGLKINDIRKLAFQIAEKNGLSHNFNQVKQMAGKAWYYAFMKRHKDKVSLRQPEATSLNRAKGFNRENIAKFFDIYEQIVDKHGLTASKIFNVDESGFQTVQKKPQKVIGGKGKKQIGALTSGERGVNTTMVACASASGQFIPPMIIFKRMRKNDQLKIGSPTGSLVEVSESGYINRELFYQWMEHFISVVKPTKEDKVLLLLDGHTTHSKNLEALSLAREKGVILLQLPGHTTHRLQPLDVSFFKPMSTYYTQAIEKWMRTNPGSAVTQYQVSGLINEAYERAATFGNVANGFRATGIWPVNRHVFQDYHFAAADALTALVFDENGPLSAPKTPNPQKPTSGLSTPQTPVKPHDNETSSYGVKISQIPGTSQAAAVSPVAEAMTDKRPKLEEMRNSLNILSPLPKNTKASKGRGAQNAVELTSSPYKNYLENLKSTCKQSKKITINKNIKSLSNTKPNKSTKNTKTDQENMNKKIKLIPKKKNERGVKKKNDTKKGRASKKRKLEESTESSEECSEEEEAIVLDDSDSDLSANSDNECAKCKINYWDKKGPKVDWVKCVRCHKWNHETCTSNPDICDDCLF